MAPHSSTLAWKIPWTEEPGRLQSMGSLKSQTRLSNFTFTFHFHALEKEMTTHSSVLAWRIPGRGEPGGLLSMGSHRVRHDWTNLATAAAAAAAAEITLKVRGDHFCCALIYSKQKLSCFLLLKKFFLIFLATSHGMWDLNSSNRDQTWVPCIGSMES